MELSESDHDFLFSLLNTPSPSGFEAPGQRVWMKYMRGHADSVESDAYGTAWATLRSGKPGAITVMLETHADEIGFIVRQITSEGYLRMERIGGSDAATARGRQLVILTGDQSIPGVIGNTAIHLRRDTLSDERPPKVHDLYVDIGAGSSSEAAAMGIRVGHPAVYADSAKMFGARRIVGRALDNRIGSFIAARVLANLRERRDELNADFVALNAVQEEIGGGGAMMAAHRLNPDVALVLDVTHATDSPGIDVGVHGEVKLGAGPTVTHGAANHLAVVNALVEASESAGTPLQHESVSRVTGTDADVIYTARDGIPTAVVSLPLRYMHSVVELADLGDVDAMIRWLTHFVLTIQPGQQFRIEL